MLQKHGPPKHKLQTTRHFLANAATWYLGDEADLTHAGTQAEAGPTLTAVTAGDRKGQGAKCALTCKPST